MCSAVNKRVDYGKHLQFRREKLVARQNLFQLVFLLFNVIIQCVDFHLKNMINSIRPVCIHISVRMQIRAVLIKFSHPDGVE